MGKQERMKVNKNEIFSATSGLNEVIEKCNLCDLCGNETNRKYGKMLGFGYSHHYMIVGINPSIRREGFGKYAMYPDFSFSSTPNGFLAKCFNEVGLNWDQCYVTNILKCSTLGNNEPESNDAVACFNNIFMQEYTIVAPQKIIAFGEYVFNFLTDNLKNVDIHQVFHHSYIARQPSKFEQWKMQFKNALEIKNGRI